MLLLAADIGGTKTLLTLAEYNAGRFTTLRQQRFDSAAHSSFSLIAQAFLQGTQSHAACFAVAGPVENLPDRDVCHVTNLPWRLDSAALATELNIQHVKLINDFQAVGYGIEHLGKDDILTLQAGQPKSQGVRAVIGAGTGLGQALLVWSGSHYEVIGTEGGHTDFAPDSELEVELWRWLRQQHGHVSYERVVSGMGIASIYGFLRERTPQIENDELKAVLAAAPDTAATLAAWTQRDGLARQTFELFARVYGAQAGNLALTVLPQNGLFIAGGIAAKNLELMQAGGFMQAFRNKGRMSRLMETIPVHIVTHPHVGLLGATHQAARLGA